jgi:hypothetical protein
VNDVRGCDKKKHIETNHIGKKANQQLARKIMLLSYAISLALQKPNM